MAASNSPFSDKPNPNGFHPGIMSLENEGAYAVMDEVRLSGSAGIRTALDIF
jgi:hypothetical protein